MAKYDDPTKEFMKSVTALPSLEEMPSRIDLRTALGATKAIVERKPSELGKMMMGRGLASLARTDDDEEQEKTSAPLTNPDVLKIYEEMNEKYGQDWWDWEPETVKKTLFDDFNIDLGEDGENILSALQLLLNTDQAHEHWHIFEKVGHAFNANIVDFTILQPLELDEIALTKQILDTIRPDTEFDDEIYAYIAAAARNSGVVYLPPEWFGEKSQSFLDEVNNDLHLKGTVISLWNDRADGTSVEEKIQLGRLKEIRDYLKESKDGS